MTNEKQKEENKVSDSPVNLSYWNNKGEINLKKSFISTFLGSVAVGRVSTYGTIFSLAFFKYSVLLHSEKEETKRFLDYVKEWYKNEWNEIILGNIDFFNHIHFYSFNAITTLSISFFIYKFIKYIIEKSEIQRALSSLGLNQYYLTKINKNTLTYTFKLIRGKTMDYKTFEDTTGNLKQLFGYDQAKCERVNKREIRVMFNHKFPSKEDLKELNVQDFQKKGYIFLGIGLPKIGENIPEKDRVLGKYVAKYLKYEELPQGIGNFGGAGFGKSNTLNQFFQGIFYNFDKVQSFTFCDFKQGIERQPYKDLEDKINTGRIFTLDDDRLMLLNYLMKLLIIVKARGKWLKNSKGKKKIVGKDIHIWFDEMREILDYEPRDKVERQIQDTIYRLIESLLRIGRRGGMKMGYSTQSPLQNASGLSSGMKNNTPLMMTHGLISQIQVNRVYEDFESWGIEPTKFDIGRLAIVNTTTSQVDERRALYVPENFMENIQFGEYIEDTFDEEIKEYYKLVVEEETRKSEIMNKDKDDEKEEVFSREEILEELLNGVLVNYDMYSNGDIEKINYSSENRVKKQKTKEELEYEKQFFDMVADEDKTEQELQRQEELNILLNENVVEEDEEYQFKSVFTDSEVEILESLEKYENWSFEDKEKEFEETQNKFDKQLTNVKKILNNHYKSNKKNQDNNINEVDVLNENEQKELQLLDEL